MHRSAYKQLLPCAGAHMTDLMVPAALPASSTVRSTVVQRDCWRSFERAKVMRSRWHVLLYYSLAIVSTGIVRAGGVHSGTDVCSYRCIVSGDLSSQLLAPRSTATFLFHSSTFARLVACHPEAASELFFEQQQTPTCIHFNALLLCPNDLMMIYQCVSKLSRHDNT